MRVLLLHSEDQLPVTRPGRGWDLVVDLGRAPAATYQRWSAQAACRVISLYDFVCGREDVQRVRELFQLGMGRMVDDFGIDWWDVLSLLVEPDLRQLILLERLARELQPGCELFATRPMPLASALQTMVGAKAVKVKAGFRPVRQWARHYRDVFSQLDMAQISQVLQDKFDREHRVRRSLTSQPRAGKHPLVLLPSAYINVSRTAASYAALLPDERFLLVYARNSAQLKSLPSNVSTASLDGYFGRPREAEAKDLGHAWERLKVQLIGGAAEYSAADAAGLLEKIPGLLRWGIAVRDAWDQVFKSETIAGCLCADDSNPYTRLPLILARNRGIPTLACHHGAMDSKMAVKVLHADHYLAKGEIERDYLVRACEVPSERVVLGGQGATLAMARLKSPALSREVVDESGDESRRKASGGSSGPPWLVFFTEPYGAAGWRNDEVYQELLPRVWSLAQSLGLKLVFKLHPFESVRGQRRMLRKYLPAQEAEIGVIAGETSPQLWSNTRLALTVQSTVALQCGCLGIPVFLCAWLRDSSSGYVDQFSRFGIGQRIESADELSQIPRLLGRKDKAVTTRPALWETMEAGKLRELLLQTPFTEAIRVQA